ncbi:MAG: 50S ribosomal protein L6 [Patescibacteria group bacterium]
MSKIGKKPITIPDGTDIKINENNLSVSGKKGSLILKVLPYIKIKLENEILTVGTDNDIKQARSNWGTMRALIQNAIIGVNEGFSKNLEIEGIGYRATMEGNNLTLNLGFSHPVKIIPPAEIIISIEKNMIKVSGIDKGLVGKIASDIRATKKPEPYKGKGIRYQGEFIRRKEGKKAAGATK